MKNVITLDTEEGLVPELNVISTAENAIYFRIYNPGTSAKLEVLRRKISRYQPSMYRTPG